MEIHSSGSCTDACGQTGRDREKWMDMMKLIGTFCDYTIILMER